MLLLTRDRTPLRDAPCSPAPAPCPAHQRPIPCSPWKTLEAAVPSDPPARRAHAMALAAPPTRAHTRATSPPRAPCATLAARPSDGLHASVALGRRGLLFVLRTFQQP